jgi:alpha-1,3-rhamnosyl/mannosyltransferase
MMDVILNAQCLSPPLTGIGRYTLEIQQGVQNAARVNNVHCFAHGAWIDACKIDLLNTLPAQKGTCPARGMLKTFAKKIPFAYEAKKTLEQWVLQRNVAKLRNPVYHETNYILSSFDLPTVVTIHDLSHILYPQCHPRERVRYLERELPKTLEQADHIICVSRFVRDQLHDILGVDREKITPIHLGVSTSMRPCSREQVVSVLKRYALPEKGYILVVATREPRKNLERLVKAYLHVQQGLRPRLPLVFAGDKGWKSRHLDKELRGLESQGLVRTIGYVPEKDLPFIYSGATVFAFVSLYEGFGLPPLEAMACGTPVLAADTSAMTEVIADAGLLVDPYDIDAIASGLTRLLGDDDLRSDLARKGIQRAASFTWDRCVEKTIDVYEQVAGTLDNAR